MIVSGVGVAWAVEFPLTKPEHPENPMITDAERQIDSEPTRAALFDKVPRNISLPLTHSAETSSCQAGKHTGQGERFGTG